MSATATEPVAVPAYLQTVSTILRLAHELFYAHDLLSKSHEQDAEPVFKAWLTLRSIARLLCERRAHELTLGEAYELREALKHCDRGEDFETIYRQQWDERG